MSAMRFLSSRLRLYSANLDEVMLGGKVLLEKSASAVWCLSSIETFAMALFSNSTWVMFSALRRQISAGKFNCLLLPSW